MVLTVNNRKYTVQLADTDAARAFADLLPLTLDMDELNGNEKYVYLGSHLPSSPHCPTAIHAGDLMLFGSNCLVLFYESFHTRYSYSRIGRLTAAEGLREALGTGSVSVTFE
ncbi:MAG: hypothetical protein K6A82_09010 [Prevotella sp.]|nr:hypothetical protein [Prevotella sp.]